MYDFNPDRNFGDLLHVISGVAALPEFKYLHDQYEVSEYLGDFRKLCAPLLKYSAGLKHKTNPEAFEGMGRPIRKVDNQFNQFLDKNPFLETADKLTNEVDKDYDAPLSGIQLQIVEQIISAAEAPSINSPYEYATVAWAMDQLLFVTYRERF